MAGDVTVSCPACALSESFDSLGAARAFVERHRVETGHDPTWAVGSLADGVERAGDEAGVCGSPECTDTGSPLYQSDSDG